MAFQAKWIKPAKDMGEAIPAFQKEIMIQKPIQSAVLSITALGVYEAFLNGSRIGDFLLAPGWTSYEHRLQYQSYDVASLLVARNRLKILVGKGWYRSRLVGWQETARQGKLRKNPPGLIAQLDVTYEDGTSEQFLTDESWSVSESSTRFSDIYDGEICDASLPPFAPQPVQAFEGPDSTLIPQEGERITAHERLSVAEAFTTPGGDTVMDFGQEITGYVELHVHAKKGEAIDLSFAEVLDKDGNFYNANYRSAKCQYHYICRDGEQQWHPAFTFYGFRYIRINAFPGGAAAAKPENFTAVAVHSDLKRTGYLDSSDLMLNRLFENCIWGQKGNFLDVPTDCPQRDERLGWTGDAQVFVKTAALNFDVERFFTKWLADLAADQHKDGYVGHVIPDLLQSPDASSAWGDAAAICPWEIYLAYGNGKTLQKQYGCMKKWADYISAATTTPFLWTGGSHYGDWLGLDAPSGSYKGSTREDFIASAFYARSVSLVIKAGKVLEENVQEYENLYQNIVEAFRKAYPVYLTQTECVLAAHFHLAENPQAAADQLAQMVCDAGGKLQTGFVGTPYLLHALSNYGYADLAYSLLLRKEYPSWLYPVSKGATTIWEHWDGIMEDGGFWSADMNSFNHYAYGSVLDWVYTQAAGIQALEDAPGYQKVRIAPLTDARLGWLAATLETRHGKIQSSWKKDGKKWRFDISTAVEAEIVIGGRTGVYPAGDYVFYEPLEP